MLIYKKTTARKYIFFLNQKIFPVYRKQNFAYPDDKKRCVQSKIYLSVNLRSSRNLLYVSDLLHC